MHKDTTDRILVASACVELMSLVTSNRAVLAFTQSTGLAPLRA